MRILGIDPGVATVGFGVIDSEGGRQRMVQYGAITTPAGMPLAARLVQIGGDLEQLIRQFQPDEMSIEELFFSKNLTPGIAVAHGRGVQLYTANHLDGQTKGKQGIPLQRYGAFCLETQHYPDSPHHPDFPDTLLRAGEHCRHTTMIRFSW